MEKIAALSRDNLHAKRLVKECINECDVLRIWNELCHYIRDELERNRAVVLPGFGTFTHIEYRLDCGHDRALVKMRPAFVLSDKFAQRHAVHYEKQCVKESLPGGKINYVALCERLNKCYPRDVVEIVLTEAFQALDYFLRSEGCLSVPFHQLGVLRVASSSPKTKKQASFEFTSCLNFPIN